MTEKLISSVAKYYTNRIEEFGATAKGVDWNGVESQTVRFQQLSKIIESDVLVDEVFKIADLGCGYGAYYDFLKSEFGHQFDYFGYDVSSKMCDAARSNIGRGRAQITCSKEIDNDVDYAVASGIFNVRLEEKADEWQDYFYQTISGMFRRADRGISFNCLTSFSDEDRMKDYLFYADPCEVFKFCKNELSKEVALIHDYGLYEFTILVRK
ncbi:hypothetical protein NBRC116583_23960 [Arenicella sp. 4NH20-0111]|uniref:class I SAM-dependent methyltransferase n=1 Tax=Arenicella sp. 4NH20-0111 TaxID=3127648 RepID=UPI0031056EBD